MSVKGREERREDEKGRGERRKAENKRKREMRWGRGRVEEGGRDVR